MTSSLINNTDFIALDTETGGLNAAECALLSIAAVPSWGAKPFSIHVLPVGRIDAKAAEVNGYSAEEWARRGAVTPKMALLELRWWLMAVCAARFSELANPMWRFDMAAHNAGFDALFLLAAMQRTGVDPELPKVWHCTKILMEEARGKGLIVEPEIAHPENEKPGNHLNDLGRLSGFWDLEPRAQAHDALQDARCCMHGLKWLRGLKDGRKGAQKIQNGEVGGHQLSGAERIAAERRRQLTVEDWKPWDDDGYVNGELRDAGIAYAMACDDRAAEGAKGVWPWDETFWKPSEDPIRNLEKAGALFSAEIDRLLRKEGADHGC